MGARIPFNRPFVAGKELYYIAQAVTFGNIAGDGHFTQQCSRTLEQRFGIAKVLMVPSCTAALEIAAMLADLKEGDEVILPSFTFVSTANAVMRMGAKPVFVDVRPDTLNIDDQKIEDAITSRTKAIFPVHYAGVACEMDRILAIASQHGLTVIEDAAQGVNSFYDGRALGSIGQLGAYSFHETKNYICGEGVPFASMIRSSSSGPRSFATREPIERIPCGAKDKYTWVEVGSSYVPSEIVSAFLFAQLEMLDVIAERRQRIYQHYRHELKQLEAEGLLRLPHIPDDCRSNYHMFYILVQSQEIRDELMEYLRKNNIQAVFHYVPLHTSPMGESLGYGPGDLPVTEEYSGRILRLPFFYDIAEEEQARVVGAISEFLRHHAPTRRIHQSTTTGSS
ncbi:MAG: dTDP-4-amino-4,6-dideoxygalactose transaminase [Planctomycetota bacterium]